MAIKTPALTRWNVASIAAGGIAWAAIMLLRRLGAVTVDDLDVFLLLAVLVVVPLALPMVVSAGKQSDRGALYQLAILSQPVAAVLGGIALLASVGSAVAGVTAVLWLLYTALLGLLGLAMVARMWLKRRLQLAGLSLALALVYLPIGGAWLTLARLGIRPLGFSATTVLLTAVHFHFITLAALIITGCTGLALPPIIGQRGIAWNSYRVAVVGMLVCPLLVAAGITATQLTGQRALESVAAVLLALSLIAVAVLSLRFAVPSTTSLLARALLAISGISVFLTMALAAAYALGRATGAWTLTIAQMIAIHGWLNALAFGLCGLLGWRLSPKAMR
jgi:hypothetical protein